jgi:hypothetical protein
VDLNHRPHAYQACALNQLSYRPALIGSDPSKPVSKNRRRETRQLGPWKLNSKRYEDAFLIRRVASQDPFRDPGLT